MITANVRIHSLVRRSNLNTIVVTATVIVLVVAMLAVNYRYWYNFFLGPFETSRDQLLGISDPDTVEKYFISFKADEAYDTGYQLVETSESGTETVKANYTALAVGDRLLLARAPEVLGDDKLYIGALVQTPSDVQDEVLDDMVRSNLDLKGAFLPYMLEADDFRNIGYIGIAVSALVLIVCFWLLIRAIRRSIDPAKHPIIHNLRHYGEPLEMAQMIEKDLASHHLNIGRLHLTWSWLVDLTKSSLAATRHTDVMWFYKHITQHRTNGIPTGKTYAAMVWDRHGKCITLTGRETMVDQMLQEIAGTAPWAFWGYTKDLETAWKKNRETFVAAVDQRAVGMKNKR